jgi:hypothetical protein
MQQLQIDEESLERDCIRALQRVDRGQHSSPAPDTDELRVGSATLAALGWMYMDLERAVVELESIVGLQQSDGLIPKAVGSDGAAVPLLASILRMIYHCARTRHSSLLDRLSQLVPAVDAFHRFCRQRDQRHLTLSGPDDERLSFQVSADPGQWVENNALLVQAETDLADVAIHTSYPTRDIVSRRTRRAQAVGERLWRQELALFCSTCGNDEEPTWQLPSVGGLLPLWAGAARRDQARQMVRRYLTPGAGIWTELPLASFDPVAAGYQPGAVGRGAVDPLLNWLMIRGIYRYGFDNQAMTLHQCTLRLAAENGLWEAYNSETGEGLGLGGTAATAALVLDLLKTPTTYDRW